MHTNVRRKLILLFSMALILVVALCFVLENNNKRRLLIHDNKERSPDFPSTELMDSGRGNTDTPVLRWLISRRIISAR